jgi:tetratricopeptide (TPR) repeat protein
LAVALAALTLLYGDALRTGFLNDDYLFLEEAARPLAASLIAMGPLGNYYRPVSRQLYFELLAPVADGNPRVFHLVNFALFLAALVLLADLLRVLVPREGVPVGLLYFALVPFQRVNLTWVSCAQDLLALTLSLAALALFRRRLGGWAVVAYGLAIFSKESALPMVAIFAASMWCVERGRTPEPGAKARAAASRPVDISARLAPFALMTLVWLAASWIMRHRHPAVAAPLHFAPGHFVAAYAHEIQSLLGLEHPSGFLESLGRHGPAPLPLLLLAALGLWLGPAAGPAAPTPLPARRALAFAIAWLLATGLVIGPVASIWSGYYYSLSAVAGALLMAWLFRRVSRVGWVVLTAGLLWWHAAGSGTRAFAVADRPWGWTSHLTSFYFQRAAALTDTLSRQLLQLEPSPAHRTRFFFSTLPPWAGFQMGNGALVRALYHDPSIESYFYSQFSESTAGAFPCRFLYWDGLGLAPLHARSRDPFFQVGTDLLAFGRPDGAVHAFRRGLAARESRLDHLYWLGWAELWRGRRAAAEQAWWALGARDDSLCRVTHLRQAGEALLAGRDSLEARRQLSEAIRCGIGRPEAHAALGELLLPDHPKYGVLELQVAARLGLADPRLARDRALALVDQHLDDPAREALAELDRLRPPNRADSLLEAARRTLQERSQSDFGVPEF